MPVSKRSIASDLAKVDAHIPRPADYDDAPELPDDFFEKAVMHIGGVPARRGRPRLDAAKRQVTLRLSPSVLDHFRATGPGWQSRINETLELAVARRRKG